MVDLVEMTPCAGLVPVTAGALRLTEAAPGRMTVLAVFQGQEEALGRALAQAHGLGWPAPGEVIAGESGAVQWFGRDLALLVGPEPDAALADHAALTDQSDAWAVLRIEGPGATAVMARLTPLDLRDSVFGVGRTARTDVAHMAGAVTRAGTDAYDIMAFRSMAASLVHEVAMAMRRVAARTQ
ncbi:sarcosine oxidase subunit gamma [Roseovarius sp. A46]|uniref:sarcosine oxidase subunit gamma n=1 Tax=Roseovarius sp. A46 TaxID=2109331 RepID=UPI0010103824|nr:sarcosine oxidase subunit gamma [Roseovarius sp. A46]RXV66457.1 sarcosine oxidase subunit gamma [Roseovarius sp. A46]